MKQMSESEFKKEAFASLKAEYLFVIIPFLLLVFIKWINNSIEDILLTSDWSLASCIIFGQVALKVSQAVAENNNRMHVGSYGYYSTKRLLGVIISILLYCAVILKPSSTLGGMQILWFFIATYFHFKDGFAAKLLIRKGVIKKE